MAFAKKTYRTVGWPGWVVRNPNRAPDA